MRIIDRKLKKCINKSYHNLVVDLQKEIDELEEKYDIKIYICNIPNSKKSSLNAMYLFANIVVFNSIWIYKLLNSIIHEPQIKIAFYQTIGHELTHKDGDYKFFEISTKDKKFVNWINEVHADFGSAKKVFDGKRENLIISIMYKKENKGNKDKDLRSHPSWSKRLEYVSGYNFDENLITLIAEEVDCKNENLINSIINYYESINLY